MVAQSIPRHINFTIINSGPILMYTPHFLPTPLADVEANPRDHILPSANTSVCISKRNRPSVKKHKHNITFAPKTVIHSLISFTNQLVFTPSPSVAVPGRGQIKCVKSKCLIYFLGFFSPILWGWGEFYLSKTQKDICPRLYFQ